MIDPLPDGALCNQTSISEVSTTANGYIIKAEADNSAETTEQMNRRVTSDEIKCSVHVRPYQAPRGSSLLSFISVFPFRTTSYVSHFGMRID